MTEKDKTKELIRELAELRNRIAHYSKRDAELTRENEHLTVTLHSIGDGVITTDTEGSIIQFNGSAGKLTGWTRKEVIGKPLGEVFCIVDDKTREPGRDIVNKVIESGETTGLPRNTVLITKDGAKRFVSASCAPIRDGQGAISGAVLVFRDITRIKEAEEAVRESEKKYRTIVENSYDLIYEVDSKGKILYVNPACKEIAGYEQDEFVGKSAFDFIHPEDLSNAMSVFQRAVLNLSTEGITFRARDKSGQYHWLECTGKPFLTATGEIRGVIILRDVTERKQSEEELTVLNTLMNTVHRFLDLNEVYKVALDMIINMENVDMTMIYLADKEKNEAVLQAQRNLPDFYVERAGKIPYPKGVTWKVINSGDILNIENAPK